jgi:nitrogen fixation NifU-like protein
MSDLNDLYQDLIVDHNKSPRNRGRLACADRSAEGFNPLCGDHITIYLAIEDDVVKDISFEGSGCAISTASASLMTESVKGKTLAEAQALFRKMHDLVTGQPDADLGGPALGKLEAFSGVCHYPARVKCATLAWHTVNAAIKKESQPVSTE